MTFTKIEKRYSGQGAFAEDWVKARCWGERFELMYSRDINHALGEPERMAVLVGAGQDKGKIALEPDPKGYVCSKVHDRSHVMRVCIARKKIGAEPFEARLLDHEIINNRLIVYLDKKMRKQRMASAPLDIEDPAA